MAQRIVWFGIVFVAAAVTTVAGGKRPWDWTDGERIAARFDTHAIEQRATAYGGAGRTRPESASSSPRVVRNVIDGRRNPELLMRFELFDDLLRTIEGEPRERDRYRELFEPDLRAAGFKPAAFWNDLSNITRRYVTVRAQVNGRRNGRGRLEADQLCRERAASLSLARRQFGSEKFDRFLYTAVAPHVIRTQATTFPDAAARLRREAEGCQ